MKIYISGKITGLPIKAVTKKFKETQNILESKGFQVVNPFELNKNIKKSMPTWMDYMINDISYLFDCDAIYMIENWGQSKGSRIEYAIAKELNLKIYFAE